MSDIPIERERKFLVVDLDELALDKHTPTRIRQGYLVSNDVVELRIRLTDESVTLGIKSGDAYVSRVELEFVVPEYELGFGLFDACRWMVEKDRYDVVVGDHVWNVDVFRAENEGLILAEVEFAGDETVLVPRWAGTEVTGDGRYYNRSLARSPFGSWSV